MRELMNDQYTMGEEMGEGGFGYVVAALHTPERVDSTCAMHPKQVAVKVFKNNNKSSDIIIEQELLIQRKVDAINLRYKNNHPKKELHPNLLRCGLFAPHNKSESDNDLDLATKIYAVREIANGFDHMVRETKLRPIIDDINRQVDNNNDFEVGTKCTFDINETRQNIEGVVIERGRHVRYRTAITELLSGEDVLKRVSAERHNMHDKFTERNVARMLYGLASALDMLHQNNIIHRDIKLDNIVYRSASIDAGKSNSKS